MRHLMRRGRGAMVICLSVAAALAAGPGLAAGGAGASTTPRWHAAEVYLVAPSLGRVHGDIPPVGFDALSCTGPGACMAAGSYLRRDNFQVRPMAATESGGAWAVARRIFLRSSAADPGGQGRINAMSCPSRDWCVAGGQLGEEAAQQPFLITGSGGTWSRPIMVRLPHDSDGSGMGSISGITCSRPGSCLAVGRYNTGSATGFVPMAVTSTGGRWGRAVAVQMPPGGTGGTLSSVRCPRAGLCVAVGAYANGSFETGMEALLSGGRWHRAIPMQLPAGTFDLQADLASVSCLSPTSCLAIGDAGGPVYTIFEHGRWRRPRYMTTVPAGGSQPVLKAVSCVQGSCLAAGTYIQQGKRITRPAFVVTFSRGRWRDPARVRLPRDLVPPGGTLAQVIDATAVNCVSSASCTVMGLYDTKNAFRGWAATGPTGDR